MRLINQISVNDDTFSIIEMDHIDRTIITDHVGPLNGQWICYNGLMTIYPDRFKHQRGRMLFWTEVTPEMTFATQREAELYAQMRIYQKAYAQIKFAVALMNDTIARTDKGDYNTAINHKEEK